MIDLRKSNLTKGRYGQRALDGHATQLGTNWAASESISKLLLAEESEAKECRSLSSVLHKKARLLNYFPNSVRPDQLLQVELQMMLPCGAVKVQI